MTFISIWVYRRSCFDPALYAPGSADSAGSDAPSAAAAALPVSAAAVFSSMGLFDTINFLFND